MPQKLSKNHKASKSQGKILQKLSGMFPTIALLAVFFREKKSKKINHWKICKITEGQAEVPLIASNKFEENKFGNEKWPKNN